MGRHPKNRGLNDGGCVNPMMVCEKAHTMRIPENSALLKDKTDDEEKEYIDRMHKRKMAEVANYLAHSMNAHADK
jgi:hypothetical protein